MTYTQQHLDETVKITRRLDKAEFRTGRWDPFAFIDYCEKAARQPGSEVERRAVEMQQIEWELLFDYCVQSGRRG